MKQGSTKFLSQKTDLLLINQISKPSRISQLQAPSNMHQLHNLLRQKNMKNGRSKQQKQNAQSWLNKEGFDISPLLERVKKAKQIDMQKQQMKKIEEDCLFYIPDMNYKKIDEYLIKAHDYGMMKVVQSSMIQSNQSKINRKKAYKKFMSISGSSKQLGMQRSLGLVTAIKTQTRDQQKRQRYIKCITAMGKSNIQRDELVHHISNSMNNKFWKILSKHTRCLNQAKSLNNNQKLTYLHLQSLRLVQDEYDSYLSRGTQSLNYYLSSNYLQKLQKRQQKYFKDREHQSFWGKAFILYRAGRRKDFYSLLGTRNQNQLMRDFKHVDQSIEEKCPLAVHNKNYNNIEKTDVFKEQLIYALKGQPKYSSQVLSDPATLDFVWILLRNIGIFYSQSGPQFDDYKSKVLDSYGKQGFLTSQQLYNYLYLLAYDEIAEMGMSDIMDQDDYVHFLICLSQNPGLLGNKYQKVQKLLSKQLMLYIRQLISLGRSQYIYYMSLIPKQDRATQISTLLSSSNLITSTNWQYLRESIPTRQQFQQLVKKTLDKYIVITNDYLSAAQKYVELLSYNQDAVRCLLQFLIRNFYNSSCSDQAVYQAESACERYLFKRPELQHKFRDVLKFMTDCRKLLEMLKDRKDVQIYNFVKNTDLIILGSALPAKNQEFLDSLISISGVGMDIYFKFLKHVIKGLQIYYLRKNKNEQQIQFMSLLQENIDFILSFDKYKAFKGRQQAISLIQLINSNHYQVNQY